MPRAITLVLLLLAACSARDGRAPEVVTPLGPDGGQVGIGEGVLEGFRLEVPAGALAGPVDVSVTRDPGTQRADIQIASPPARIAPRDVELSGTVRATLPFVASLVGPAEDEDLFVVLRDDRNGDLDRLTPESVDRNGHRVTVRLRSFGTVWVGVPSVFEEFDFAEYLPFHDGDRYRLAPGLEIAVDAAESVPNLDVTGAFTWTFRTPLREFGFYVTREPDGSTREHGRFSIDEDSQEMRAFPLHLLPGPAGIGTQVAGHSGYEVFRPIGSSSAAGVGHVVSWAQVVGREAVTTPAGLFPDALEVEIEMRWQEPNRAGGVFSAKIWFARHVGPVKAVVGANPEMVLAGATVGGARIGVGGG